LHGTTTNGALATAWLTSSKWSAKKQLSNDAQTSLNPPFFSFYKLIES
jgi:molecular chaperone DnaK (HSP70)